MQVFPEVMGVHHVTWVCHGSAVSNLDIISDSLRWLSCEAGEVEISKFTSHHGSEQFILRVKMGKSKKSIQSLRRLGKENLRFLVGAIDEKLTEKNELHIRINLESLIAQDVILSKKVGSPVVKGVIKFQVYPNQSARSVASEVLQSCLTDF